MFNDIVVNLWVGLDRDPASDYALSVAQAFNAHATGIAFAYDPFIPANGALAIPPQFVEEQLARAVAAANAAIAKFEELARRMGLSVQTRAITTGAADASEQFGRIARRFDLSILLQNQPGRLSYRDLLIEAALFDSGRPILVVPYIQTEGLSLNHVLVCWDGSRNAARALGDAEPLLARAKAIEVVTISSDIKSPEISGFDIARHLARHGFKVELKNITRPGMDVANTILSYAADVSADLIVMGGYGHSRLREFILGGATRGILATMTVPTFMSH